MSGHTDILRYCYALTGSIATGKSTVARFLAGRGARVIDTDLIAREVVEPGQPALDEIRREFGDAVINGNGTLNREAMRRIIIHDESKKLLLNSITHPKIQGRVLDLIQEYNSASDTRPIIIDVPLLFEVGWDRFFPRIILAYAPRDVQVERLMERDSLDRETAMKNVEAQIDIEEKKDRATHVIDNSGTMEETRGRVEELFSVISYEVETVNTSNT